jgi:hypothetical protein
MVLGGGTIADMIPRDQRGTAMAVWMTGPSKYPSSTKYRRFLIDIPPSYRSLRRTDCRRLPYRR